MDVLYIKIRVGIKEYTHENQILLERNFNNLIKLFREGKDENIGNYGYIGIPILRIYWKYIDGYFGKKHQ